MSERLAIVVPVLDDWESFATLVSRIAEQFAGSGHAVRIVAVDDGSTESFDPSTLTLPAGFVLSVVRLAVNLGHQRAIAVGLSVLARRDDIDLIVVMDGDGEDRPEDIAVLLAAHARKPSHTVLAQRAQRSERGLFRIGYFFYKRLFRILTGRTIDFGNFTLLPMSVVRRLTYTPDLWNNLPAALIRSGVPHIEVPIDRGTRYAGQSKMNLAALITHGLSAMSVYTDVIFVRVIMAAGCVAMSTLVTIIGVLILRMFTNMGVPGWASAMVGDLMIILLQTLVMVIASCLVLLGGRSQRPVIPFLDAPAFIFSQD